MKITNLKTVVWCSLVVVILLNIPIARGWYNASLVYRRDFDGTSTLVTSVNGSGITDIDGNANFEGLYAVPYFNQDAYIYYNSDTDLVNANETNELCLYDSLNNRTDCPNIPNGLISYWTMDEANGDLYDFISDCNNTAFVNQGNLEYRKEGVGYYSLNATADTIIQIESCLPVDVFSDNNDFTISFWFYVDRDWIDNGIMEVARDSDFGWYRENTGDKLYFYWKDTTPTTTSALAGASALLVTKRIQAIQRTR